MASIRQNVGTGGLYPTGRSPLAVDLASPITAITQRMIKREEQRIGEEKEIISENQKRILEALDFEVVQGLSDKIQTEHLENLDKKMNEWADVFAANDGKLSFKQLKQLQSDRREIESQLGKMQTDVKTFATAQDILGKPDAYYWYELESWDRLAKYAQEGKIGSGDAMDILVPRQPSHIEVASHLFGKDMEQVNKMTSSIISSVNSETGIVRALEENVKQVEQRFEAYKNDPRYRQSWERKKLTEEQAKKDFVEQFSHKRILDNWESTLYKVGQKEAGGNSYYSDKYGEGWSGLGEEETNTAAYLNDLVEGVLQLDSYSIDLLKRQPLTNFGIPKSITVQTDADGNDYLVWKGQQSGNPIIKKLKMPDRDNVEQVRQFKIELLADYRSIAGKDKPKGIGWVEPDWFEFEGGAPVKSTNILNIEKFLDVGQAETKKIVEPNVSREEDSSAWEEYDKDYSDLIADRLKLLVPDVKISTSRWGQKVTIKEGEESKTYDLKKDGERAVLKEWVQSKVNFEEKARQKYSPRTEEQRRMNEQIKKAKERNLTFEDFIEKIASDLGISAKEAMEQIESEYGITKSNY